MAQTLDYSGVKIVAVAGDGTATDVTAQCTFVPPEGSDVPDEPGPVQVTATYEEDGEIFKASFDLTVRRIASVSITAEPMKKSYYVGETIDMTGLAVTAACSDGTTLDVTADCVTAPSDGTTVQTAGHIITEVFYKGHLVGQFEMTAEAAPRRIIDGGDWWTLWDDGELEVFCEGAMPERGDAVMFPWHSYRGEIGTITIADSVTSVANWAFRSCINLTTVSIPSGVTSIGFSSFRGCSSLASVTIPDSVTSIARYAFLECASLDSIEVDSDNTVFSSASGVLFDKYKTTLILYPPGKEDTTYNVPDSVYSIGESAFNSCENLNVVTIPNGVVSIGSGAFSGCTNLTSAAMPGSVVTLEDYAFQQCSSLMVATIPGGVASIGKSAFSFCRGLTRAILDCGVTSIGDSAFIGCSTLASVTIPNSVTYIGDRAFDSCYVLADVYYSGSKTEWEQISIGINNGDLTRSTIHYNSSGPS